MFMAIGAPRPYPLQTWLIAMIAAMSALFAPMMAVISGGKVIEGALSRAGAVSGEPSQAVAGQGWIKATYDFAVDGGAVSTITLMAGSYIPDGSVIINSFVDVITVPTSLGAATIAVQVNAANDIVNAAAIAGAPWSTQGRKNGIPVGTGTTSVKTTAARNVSIVIGTAALTAGKFDVWLYVVPTA